MLVSTISKWLLLLPFAAILGGGAQTKTNWAGVQAGQSRAADPAQRALVIATAIETSFGVADGTGLYREHYPVKEVDHRYSDEWPFSQAHIGLLDMTGIPGEFGTRFAAALERHRTAQMRYWCPRSSNGFPGFASKVQPPLAPGGDLYYDDNEWVGLAAVQRFLFTGDAGSLKLAKQIHVLVRAAWDSDPRHPAPGGLSWTQQQGNGDRNTVSNMPAAELALRLFEVTGDQVYLRNALRYYEWTNRTLRRSDGLYLDHIKLDGSIDRRVFSYNQGVPIGVNVLLYKLTREPRYLAEARDLADTSIAYLVTQHRLDAQPMAFNAIYFKNLLLLEAITGGSRYGDEMRDYADRMWRERRDRSTGLFRGSDSRQADEYRLIDQGAMLQINAVLAWRREDHPRLY